MRDERLETRPSAAGGCNEELQFFSVWQHTITQGSLNLKDLTF